MNVDYNIEGNVSSFYQLGCVVVVFVCLFVCLFVCFLFVLILVRTDIYLRARRTVSNSLIAGN